MLILVVSWLDCALRNHGGHDDRLMLCKDAERFSRHAQACLPIGCLAMAELPAFVTPLSQKTTAQFPAGPVSVAFALGSSLESIAVEESGTLYLLSEFLKSAAKALDFRVLHFA